MTPKQTNMWILDSFKMIMADEKYIFFVFNWITPITITMQIGIKEERRVYLKSLYIYTVLVDAVYVISEVVPLLIKIYLMIT